jgi:hypothetical protein
MNKPLLEKPFDAEDHNVLIYLLKLIYKYYIYLEIHTYVLIYILNL